MTTLQRAGYTAKEIAVGPLSQTTPSTFPRSTITVSLGKTISETWSTPGEEGASIGSYYNVGPERTNADLRKEYDAWMAQLTPQLHEYVDIDLPIVDSGGDW